MLSIVLITNQATPTFFTPVKYASVFAAAMTTGNTFKVQGLGVYFDHPVNNFCPVILISCHITCLTDENEVSTSAQSYQADERILAH
jgi:hypothetical protein